MAEPRDEREPREGRLRPRFAVDIGKARTRIAAVETGVYLIVGALLVVAGALVLGDTVKGLIDALGADPPIVEVALRALDRVLLFLIVAELLYTLQLVLARGEIFTEPFLLIGLIAVVRRVVVLTAEVEHAAPAGRELTNLLLELGLLAALALAFSLSIYLLRRSAATATKSLAPTGEAA
ncbi:MAG: phosphate-starvation-inducible PsiE family protein [Actinomycetota bacterium]|nr:phosphate-starvation-inducible PsiE family protein [Actinomycetota bacterium]